MRFEFDGTTYELDFQKSNKTVAVFDKALGAYKEQASRYPYTTLLIREVRDGKREQWPLFRTATVGCRHNERYTPERGRCHALRAVMATITRPFYMAMWKAYTNRNKPEHVEGQVLPIEQLQQELAQAVA